MEFEFDEQKSRIQKEMRAMKAVTIGIVVLLALTFVGWAWAGLDDTNQYAQQLRLKLDLVDGSHIIGKPKIESVCLQTSYSKMDIALKQILAIRMGDNHETASVDVRNGDKINGVIHLASIKLQTIFGDVAVGIEHVRELHVVVSGGALPESLRNGLVLHYSYDREQGGSLTDESPEHTVGEVLGATWTAQGHHGGAYTFDGTNAYISVPRMVQDSFAISAWIKTTAAGGGAVHYQSMPIYDSEVPWQVTHDFGFGVNSDGQLVLGEGGGGSDVTITGRTRVNTGAWMHACAVRDKETGEIEIYVNGKSDAQGFGSTATLDANPKARIGYGFDKPGNVQYWKGQIDDIMIWNRKLSKTEVEEIYNSQR